MAVFTQAVYQRDFAERYDRQVNSRESVVTSQFQKFQEGRIDKRNGPCRKKF